MPFRMIFAFIFILLIPFLARYFPQHQIAIVTTHEVLSSLIVALILFLKPTEDKNKFLLGISFLLLAAADLFYGFSGEIVLNSTSLHPLVIAREFSYTGFAVFLSIALGRVYLSSLKNTYVGVTVILLTSVFAWIGFTNVIFPLNEMPDRVSLFVYSGSVYHLLRAFILAIAIQQMAFERNFHRFLFLFAIAQMFLCELAFTFQPNVIEAIKTSLNSWLETGWQMSTAIFCVLAVFERRQATIFGESLTSHWKSVRTLTVALVTSVLMAEAAWFWYVGFLRFSDVLTITHFISLGFMVWILANAFGIAISSQISRVSSIKENAGTGYTKSLFTLEENELAIIHVLGMQRKLDEQKWLAKIGEFSAQIAHDIRSPLAALNMVAEGLDNVDEDKRILVRNAVGRINDIANQLLKKDTTSNPQPETNEAVLVSSTLDSLLSEKRVQFRSNIGITIQGDLSKGFGLFAKIKPTDLSQVVSNLVNNSIEALDGIGQVLVSVSDDSGHINISIKDNGKGIPPDVLARLGQIGVTHGKESTHSGSGLGVYHARSTIERYGGRFTIQSELGHGTRVDITLPKVTAPSWFAEKITFSQSTNVISLDDDQTVHQVWESRLRTEAAGITHKTFSSIEPFGEYLGKNDITDAIFLIDYEFLGQQMNGLDIIETYGLAAKSILVTSRFNDVEVRRRAESMQVKILPKNLASSIKLDVAQDRMDYDAVVIDDDRLVHSMWKMLAKKKGKNVIGFENVEDFENFESKIDRMSPIFIDVELGNNTRGEDIAVKLLGMGFKNISLATGYQKDAINVPKGIRRVIGKEPLFDDTKGNFDS